MVAGAFGRWLDRLAVALCRLRDAGALVPGADPDALVAPPLASIPGAYLLSATKRDPEVMRQGIDGAWAYLQLWATESRPAPPS